MEEREAINRIKDHIERHSMAEPYAVHIHEALNLAIKALEKQTPIKPTHIHEEYDKHDWKKNADGTIDDYAWENDYHSGVICNRCHEYVCTYCHDDYDEYAGKCIIDEHRCPACNQHIIKNQSYCVKCGQKIDWNE